MHAPLSRYNWRWERWAIQGRNAHGVEVLQNASSHFATAVALNPHDELSRTNALLISNLACNWDSYEDSLRWLQTAVRDQLDTSRDLTITPNYAASFPSLTPTDLKRIAIAAAGHEERTAERLRPKGFSLHRVSAVHKLLHVVYITTDLRPHPVGYNAWFHLHDPTQTKATVVSLAADDGSDVRKRIATSLGDRLVVFVEHEPVRLATDLNDLQPHVIIALNGWSAGHQISALALRPAPVQIHFFGTQGTLGSRYVEFMVNDRRATPPELSSFFTEKLIVLSRSFFVADYSWRPPLSNSTTNRPAVFCCFNSLYKVQPTDWTSWLQLLRSTPGSSLWLQRSPPVAESYLVNLALRHGIDRSRISFTDRLPHDQHLEAKRRGCRVALDTQHFNGHTTTVDMLWAGVPVVATAGEAMVGRVAASLLLHTHSAGLTLARTPEDYLTLARRLMLNATPPPPTSPVFDTASWVAELDRMLHALWDATANDRHFHVVSNMQSQMG